MNDGLLEIVKNILDLLVLASWRALPLLVIALLVDLAFGRRLAPKHQALLWTVVVVRLMLPISAPSSWSLHAPLDRLVTQQADNPPDTIQPLPAMHQANAVSIRIGDQPLAPLAGATFGPEPVSPTHFDWTELLLLSLVFMWALVAVVLLARSLLAHLIFASRLRVCRECTDRQLVDVVLRECDDLRVRRRPKLKEVDELTAPAAFGLFRSTICLPPNTIQSLSDQEFRWVLRHELAHVRRRDAWLLSFTSIMRSVHWFNPLAWCAAARLRMHVEAAADDLAIRSASPIEAIGYGRLLLRFAEQASSRHHAPAPGLLQFGSGRGLRERVKRLTRDRVPSRSPLRSAAVLGTLSIALVGLTDARVESPRPPQQEVHLPPMDFVVLNVDDSDDGPTTLQTYDVTEVLARIRQLQPKDDAEEVLLAMRSASDSERSMRIEGGQLLAEGTASRHRELSEILDAWRVGGPGQIVVEVRVMHADVSLAASIDWAAAGMSEFEKNGSRPVIAARVSDDQLGRLVRGVAAEPSSQMLMAPKLKVFNGQAATIANLVERPFVTAVETRQDGSLTSVVDLVEDGYKIALRPVMNGDDTVALSIELQASTIDDVAMANLPFRHPDAPHPNVTVQVPSVSSTSVRLTSRLHEAESLLIAMPHLFDDDSPELSTKAMFFAITPRAVVAVERPRGGS